MALPIVQSLSATRKAYLHTSLKRGIRLRGCLFLYQNVHGMYCIQNLAHLRNMTSVTEMGGIVFPPLPAFYHRPQSIDELVQDTVERVLSLVQIEQAQPQAWQGL